MALVQTVHLSMANFKSAPVVPAVQNDSDRQVKMILDDYTLTSGLTGKIAFERSDGTHYETAAELVLADNAFVADIDQALTQPGRTMVQLKVTDTLTVSTFSFVIFVEADNSGTVTPQEGIDLVTAVASAEAAADRAESAASTFETDTTLSVEGMAADAKTVGDDLDALDGRLDTIEDDYVTESEMTAAISANVDATLSVFGKSADAKVTGDGINDIYKNELSEDESASGWYIYPYMVKKGLTYTFYNTSTQSCVVSFRTRYMEQGSTIDSYDGISPGKQYTFVASDDANYLRVNYTAAGSCKMVSTQTIAEVYNYINSFDINSLKTDIVHTLSAEKSTSGRVAYSFTFNNGHRYMLKNTSTSASIAASTRSSAQATGNIQLITDGLTAGKSILFTATADAQILSLYTDGAGSFAIYDYDTVRADIDKKGNTYLPYQEGYIAFTVPVNQTIPDMSDTSASTVDSEDIVNVDCVLRLPTTYSQGGKPSKLLMICHGATHGVTGDGNWPSNGSYNQLMAAFVGAGYAVFDCNGYDNTAAGHDFWGAPRGVEAWRKAYQYIVDNYNVEHEFCIYGFSMGGLTALSLAFNRFPNIKAIGLGSCVLRLDLCIDESSMRTAYGISGTTYDASKTIGSNPYAHLLTIGSEQICDYALPPIKIWYGSTETGDSAVYVNKQYAVDFVNAIIAGGGFAQYREVSGAGHSMSYGNLQAINTEFIYWFNRFND